MHTSTRTAFAVAAVGAFLLGGGTAAQAAPAIPLNTGQEVQDIDTDAHAFFTYTIDGDQFCYTLSVTGLTTPATAAHVHLAPRNVAGPVVIPLATQPATSFDVEGCTTASETLLAAIAANPRAYYVNVHNVTYPGGEIRGQLK